MQAEPLFHYTVFDPHIFNILRDRVIKLADVRRVQFQIAHDDPFVFIDQADVLSEWSGEFCLGSSCQSSLPLRLSSTRFAIIRSSSRLLM